MRAGSGEPLQLPLEQFGGQYLIVDLLTDDGTNGSATVLTTTHTSKDQTLSIPTATNGGFAAIVCLDKPGRESCLDPAEPWAAVDLTVEPSSAEVAPGSTVEVKASFAVDADAKKVAISPVVPDGWGVEGESVTAKTLVAGDALEASWSLTVPDDAASGTVEIPVEVTYRIGSEVRTAASQSTLWVTSPPLDGVNFISDLGWLEQSNGYGPVERDLSNGQAAANDGRPIEIDDVTYAKGVGMHATGALTAWLGGTCSVFDVVVGIDDEVLETPGESGIGSVKFLVYGDGVLLGETPVLTNDDAAMPLSIDVGGVQRLRLVADEATNGKNYDHADWADAKVTCDAG
jgi:hypothetical protein